MLKHPFKTEFAKWTIILWFLLHTLKSFAGENPTLELNVMKFTCIQIYQVNINGNSPRKKVIHCRISLFVGTVHLILIAGELVREYFF